MGDYISPESGPRTDSKRPRNVNVLVTGFGAFRHTVRNPSWETAKGLSKLGVKCKDSSETISVDISYIPVEYTAVASAISYFYGLSDQKPDLPSDMVDNDEIAARSEFDSQKRYDLVLHIGQGRSGGLQVETVAHQLGYRLLDAADQLAPVIEGLEEATDVNFHIPEQVMNNQERSAGQNRGYPVTEKLRASLGPELELATTIDTADLADTLSRMFPHTRIQKSTNAGRYLCEYIYFGSLIGSIAQDQEEEQRAKVLFVHVPPENDPLSIQDMVKVIQAAIAEITATMTGGR